MAIDKNMLEVFGGIFESLQGDFIGHVEIRFFEKQTGQKSYF